MSKRKMKYKCVRIVWGDAFSQDGWTEVKDLHENEPRHVCETIGYLVNQNDHFYYVSSTISDDEAACTMAVPKGMIKEFSEISIVKKREKREVSPVPG